MILLFIFILGCFVTSIVAVGLLFALAAVGYGDEYKSDGTALAAETQEPPRKILYPESSQSVTDL